MSAQAFFDNAGVLGLGKTPAACRRSATVRRPVVNVAAAIRRTKRCKGGGWAGKPPLESAEECLIIFLGLANEKSVYHARRGSRTHRVGKGAYGGGKGQRAVAEGDQSLDGAGVPYAVAGGNAVAEWVARVDEGAVRNTRRCRSFDSTR